MKDLTYNYAFMMSEYVKTNGATPNQLKKLSGVLKDSNKKFKREYFEDYMAFHRLPDETKEILAIKYTANKIRRNFENLIVIGVGGSELGAKAATAALNHLYHNELPQQKRFGIKLYFAGDTTDPIALEELLSVIDLKKTALHVVSKSGKTIETMSAFLYIRDQLINKVGRQKHREHVFVTTSPDSGVLMKYVEDEDYTLLPHGPVGGRFSVLSAVGLLSMAASGIDIDKVMNGANSLRKLVSTNAYTKNPAFVFAALQYLLYAKGKNVCVLMPYNYKLRDLGRWFVQLWSESLGKDGRGQTPFAALGPVDQHSLLQLLQDGPNDKTTTFIVEEKVRDLKTPKVDHTDISYFGNKKFSAILNTEYETLAYALYADKRPNGTITVPEMNEYYFGQLIYFFELATAYSGELYKINAFDQPGVEKSKKYMHAELGNKDLTDTKKELDALRKSVRKKFVA